MAVSQRPTEQLGGPEPSTQPTQGAAAPERRPIRKPRYLMISSEVRRDLQQPLTYFKNLEIIHLYRSAPWNDMRDEDFNKRTIRFQWPWDLYWTISRAKPDIIQGPDPLSILMLPFLVTALVYLWLHPKVKLVTLSLEPIPLHKKYHWLVVPPYWAILALWWRRASVIFWLDTKSRDNMIRYSAPKHRLVYMLYGCWGIDVERFRPEGQAVPIATTDPVVLFAGRITPEKGLDYLFDAIRMVRDRGLGVHLALCGAGPQEQELRDKAERLGITKHVTWFGNIKHADLDRYMRAADIFALPSTTTKLWIQQLSTAAWHAMASGLPVIATQTGCLDEFTPPEAGILVPERNAQALADAIADLVSNTEKREAMSKGARAYAETRFDDRKNVATAEEAILRWCR
ncbi:MAG: glycosyltransferase [Chloroflexi bacterium]|nr:glycosyltransferase [Chloroflexota bacterium]